MCRIPCKNHESRSILIPRRAKPGVKRQVNMREGIIILSIIILTVVPDKNRLLNHKIHGIISLLREGLLFDETETIMRHISYMPLWHTLLNKNMKKEDLRIAAGLTTNMIANMGKNKGISMETLAKICDALQCELTDVIELTDDMPDETKE